MNVHAEPYHVLDSVSAERVIRAEFAEMPGMRLTLAQAIRLWPMAAGACERVLEHLVRDGILTRDRSGRYRCACTNALPRRRPGAWRSDA
jgi:hypothetical protein